MINSNKDNFLIAIQQEPIDVLSLVTLMKDKSAGALSIFLGTTRDNFEGKKVIKLSYEVHPTMATKKLKEIAQICLEKWNLTKIAIVHRYGDVPISEESIAIISTSPHRQEAIEATSFCIDEVKRIVPIWKKEIYEDGSFNWKENCNCNYKHLK